VSLLMKTAPAPASLAAARSRLTVIGVGNDAETLSIRTSSSPKRRPSGRNPRSRVTNGPPPEVWLIVRLVCSLRSATLRRKRAAGDDQARGAQLVSPLGRLGEFIKRLSIFDEPLDLHAVPADLTGDVRQRINRGQDVHWLVLIPLPRLSAAARGDHRKNQTE